MKKLFIIGNGFDIDHDLPTRYSHFQKYLMKTYPEASEEILVIPQSFIMPDGGVSYNDVEVVSFLLYLISEAEGWGKKWSNIEDALGKLDYGECFDDDFTKGDNEWHEVYRNSDIAQDISGAVRGIKKYFSNWINTIDLSRTEQKKKFRRLINPREDLFLTFNYTETLEKVYEAKNVYHIHGKQGEPLVFGHGNEEDDYDKYITRYIGSENYLSGLQMSLKKDTQTVINQYKPLFKMFGAVDEIYSYGFSFSDVDLVYIKEICHSSPTQGIVWYINDFNNKFEIYKENIMGCGFKGKFRKFSMED